MNFHFNLYSSKKYLNFYFHQNIIGRRMAEAFKKSSRGALSFVERKTRGKTENFN